MNTAYKDVPNGLQALEPGLVAFQLPLLLFDLCVGAHGIWCESLIHDAFPKNTARHLHTYLGLEHPLLYVERRMLLLQRLKGLAQHRQVFRHDAADNGPVEGEGAREGVT